MIHFISMNDGGGDGTDCSEVRMETNAVKLTDMRVAASSFSVK